MDYALGTPEQLRSWFHIPVPTASGVDQTYAHMQQQLSDLTQELQGWYQMLLKDPAKS